MLYPSHWAEVPVYLGSIVSYFFSHGDMSFGILLAKAESSGSSIISSFSNLALILS
jgi:hypothetical protein